MNTKALRQKVLDLAIHGKLVPQNPNDESATVLLEKIRAEKAEKIKKGELKADKKDSFIFVGSDKRHYEQFADGTVKDIEDEIPFDVPEGWAWCRLNQIGNTNIGLTYHPTDLVNTGTPVLRANNIQNDKLCFEELARVQTKILDNQYVANGDILICARNGSKSLVGKCTIIDSISEKMAFGAFMAIFRSPYNKYIYRYLQSNYFKDYLRDSNSTQIYQLTQAMLKNALIPLPPVHEQDIITNFIEKLFQQIETIEHNKKSLEIIVKQTKSKILDLAIHGKLVPQDPNDESAEVLLKRIATSDNRPYEKVEDEIDYEIPKNWCLCKIKDVCSVIMGQSPEGEAVSDDKNGMEFHQGKICFGKKYLEESSSFTKHITKIAPKDSVLLCVRAPVGIVNITEREICIGRGLCAVIPKYEINSDFWFYWLQSLQSDFEQKATGTTFRAISVDVIKNQIVAIPPHEEQNRIVNKINELYEQLDKIVLNLV